MGKHRLAKGNRSRRVADQTDAEITKPLPTLKAGLDALGKAANTKYSPVKPDFRRSLRAVAGCKKK